MAERTSQGRHKAPLALGRAALLGLGGGSLAGGLVLLVHGLRNLRGQVPCGSLSELECDLARQLAAEVGRGQLVAGALLLAAGLGIALLVRTRLQPP